MTTIVKTRKIYDEFLDFIAKGTTPEELTNFQFSDKVKEEIEDLVYRAKNAEITKEEKQQLEELVLIEHLIVMAKAKACQYLQSSFQKV
ncbi:hypothetical protein ACN4EE_02185 [Geminocystis sp. CENA526]|uniref:hypothetical protein n=1 Tax=Geminocystis sp. CENA526 TaxID=1355871 RepID=UPI003D6E27D4